MFLIPGLIMLTAVAAAATFEGGQRTLNNRRARDEQIRNDPLGYARSQAVAANPKAQKMSRATKEAENEAEHARTKLLNVARSLPQNPPRPKYAVMILAITALWVLAWVAQFLLDWRIAEAVTGNLLAATLSALVVSGVLTAISLAGTLLWEHRDRFTGWILRWGMIGLVAGFAAILSLIVSLAPKRAHMDYADKIDQTQNQVTVYSSEQQRATELGDTAVATESQAAAQLAQQKLDRLKTEEAQAAQYYQALAVTAGVLEAGSSLAAPAGAILILYFSAAAELRRKQKQHRRAQAAEARARERRAARVARRMLRAGVTAQQIMELASITAIGFHNRHPDDKLHWAGRLPAHAKRTRRTVPHSAETVPRCSHRDSSCRVRLSCGVRTQQSTPRRDQETIQSGVWKSGRACTWNRGAGRTRITPSSIHQTYASSHT